MDVAMIGLGRMGANMARHLLRGGHRVVVYNRTYARAEELAAEGAEPVRELAPLCQEFGGHAVKEGWMACGDEEIGVTSYD